MVILQCVMLIQIMFCLHYCKCLNYCKVFFPCITIDKEFLLYLLKVLVTRCFPSLELSSDKVKEQCSVVSTGTNQKTQPSPSRTEYKTVVLFFYPMSYLNVTKMPKCSLLFNETWASMGLRLSLTVVNIIYQTKGNLMQWKNFNISHGEF